MARRVNHHAPALAFGITYAFPAAIIADTTDWPVGWIFFCGFLVMGLTTMLAARLLALYQPGTYLTAVVRDTAIMYLFLPYLAAFVGLGFWLAHLGLEAHVAVLLPLAVCVGGLVAYELRLRPALRRRNLRLFPFLDSGDAKRR